MSKMSKILQLSGFVLLVVALAFSGQAAYAQEGAEIDPNTPVSPEGMELLPEGDFGDIRAPKKGTGIQTPMQIPEEELNLPSLDGPTPDSVFLPDGRTRITNTTLYPSRAIAWLVVTFPSGSGTCTGWFIGPRTVATAGHCLYDTATNKWATSIKVYPGRNGTSAPYGYTTAYRLRSVTGWTVSENWEYDYGIIQTNAAKGSTVGYFGFRWQSSNVFSGNYTVRGYPGDKTSGTMWTMTGPIGQVWTRKLFYRMDTYGGQSGSPLYHTFNNVCCYGVGVHAYGSYTISGVSYNSATRITQGAYNNFVTWKALPYP